MPRVEVKSMAKRLTAVIRLCVVWKLLCVMLLQQCYTVVAVPLESFYEYGPCVDNYLPPRDEISRRLRMSVPINFYGYYSCKIVIYDNGYASVVREKDVPVPLRLPAEVPFPFIAPFQSDVDIRFPKSDTQTRRQTGDPTMQEDADDMFFSEQGFTSAMEMDDWQKECGCELPESPPPDYCEDPSYSPPPVDPPPDCRCLEDMPPLGKRDTSTQEYCNDTVFLNYNPPTKHGDSLTCPPPGRVWFRESTDPDLLCRAQKEVHYAFDGYEDFAPTSLVIATWDHVGSFRRQNLLTNTFQLVIISDGNSSFAMFLYADGAIQWTIPPRPNKNGPPPPPPPPNPLVDPQISDDGSNALQGGEGSRRLRRLFGPRATVGINGGDLHRFQRTPFYEAPQLINIDQTSNVDIPGVWMFKLDGEVQVGLTQTLYRIKEERQQGKPSFVKVCIAVSSPGMIGLRPLRFLITATPGTAVNGSKRVEGDYILRRPRIRLFGESIVECTNILIIPDDIHEGSEEFTITVTQICPCRRPNDKLPPFLRATPVTIAPSTATVTIIDNDDITVGIEQTINDVLEDDENGVPQSVEVCVVIVNGTLQGTLDVILSASPGNATAIDDYLPENITLTLDEDNDSVCGNFLTIHDTEVEGDEEFFVTLLLSDADPSVVIDPQASMTSVTIIDNEIILMVDSVSSEVVEDNGSGLGQSVMVCAVLASGQLLSPLGVILRTIQLGSASRGEDYVAMEESLLLTNSNTRVCREFFTIADDEFEDTEVFFVGVDLSPQSIGMAIVTDINPGRVAISIVDNDIVTVGLTQTMMQVAEESGIFSAFSNPVEICAAVTGGTLQSSVTLFISATSGAAEYEVDFELLSDEIILGGSESNDVCGLVTIVPDTIVESNEDFRLDVTLSLSSSSLSVVVSPSSATVFIMDDDDIQIGFEESQFIIDEDDGGDRNTTVLLCGIIIFGAIENRNIELTVTPSPGTALQGVDFEGGTQTLIFDENTQRDCASFVSIPNNTPQPNRYFTAHLTSTDSDVIVDPSSATVDIIDNDDVSVAFEESSYNVTEDDGSGGQAQPVTVCVEVLNANIAVSVDILLSIVGGSASFGVDYTGDSSTVLTLDGSTSIQCVTHTSVPDNNIEVDESFEIQLSSSSEHVVFSDDSVIVFILDNDFGLESTEYTTSEALGSVKVCAIVESENARNLLQAGQPVEMGTVQGTATFGDDYARNSITLSFLSDRECLVIELIDDNIVESEEKFQVALTGAIDPGLTLSPAVADVVIEDDDMVVVSLVPPAGSVSADRVVDEDVGTIEICSILIGDIDRSIVTQFVIRSGTGSNGARFRQDFEVENDRTTHELTFTSEDLTQCIEIEISDDSRTESLEEIFSFMLVQRDAQTPLGIDSGTVTILDNDRECRTNLCLNGGTCGLDPITNDPVCVCPPLFTGRFCQFD